MKTLIFAILLTIQPPHDIKLIFPPGTVACMDGVLVVVVEFLPEGLDKYDIPRYEVNLLGTCRTAYPSANSVILSEDCLLLNDGTGCDGTADQRN